jgi:hypothetical protein
MTYFSTRRYELHYEGAARELHGFVRDVLADDVVETVHEEPGACLSRYGFYLDIGLKAGLLDLEKEYLLRYLGSVADAPFSIQEIKKSRCYYFSGDPMDVAPEQFIGDMVNPVIHRWKCAYADPGH